PIALIVCLAAWSGACAKARAHTEVPMPVLTPPEAPPRNIDTYVDEPVPTVEPPSIDAALTPPPPRPPVPPLAPHRRSDSHSSCVVYVLHQAGGGTAHEGSNSVNSVSPDAEAGAGCRE